jgi:hypothetical protein
VQQPISIGRPVRGGAPAVPPSRAFLRSAARIKVVRQQRLANEAEKKAAKAEALATGQSKAAVAEKASTSLLSC